MSGDSNIYYHGTWAGYGYSIMTRGFELGHEGRGHLLGRGVYLATRVESAALWYFGLIFRCALQPGTRILWFDDDYDRRIINSLRREFGQELLDLGPQFHKAIPDNKRLTQTELIHLCSYIFMQGRRKRSKFYTPRKGARRRYFDAWLQLSRLHEQVKRYGFDGVGDRSNLYWDSDELLIYNPSRVIPLSAHRLLREGDDWDETFTLLDPLPADELQVISEKAQAEEEEE